MIKLVSWFGELTSKQGGRPRKLHVAPVAYTGDGGNPCVGRLTSGSLKVKREENSLDPLNKKKNAYRARSQEPRSKLTAVRETPIPPCPVFQEDRLFLGKPWLPALYPHPFPQERNKWPVGKFDRTKHVSLSSFLYGICLLTENISLSQTSTLSAFNSTLKTIIPNSMSKIYLKFMILNKRSMTTTFQLVHRSTCIPISRTRMLY